MIELDQVTHRYPAQGGGRGVVALDQVSLKVAGGEFVALQGMSGSGKSTLLLIAGGLMRPSEGRVEVAGERPYGMGPEKRAAWRAASVGFVFQQFHLVAYLDVLDNVMAPGIASGRRDRERARKLIADFGLEHRLDHTPSALSMGECQRVAMARALYNEPKILLADEPTGNLDPENAKIILDRLGRFAAEGGAVLMVSHDAAAAARAQRQLMLRGGRFVSDIEPATAVAAPV